MRDFRLAIKKQESKSLQMHPASLFTQVFVLIMGGARDSGGSLNPWISSMII